MNRKSRHVARAAGVIEPRPRVQAFFSSRVEMDPMMIPCTGKLLFDIKMFKQVAGPH